MGFWQSVKPKEAKMDNNMIMMIAGVAWLLGFWSVKDIVKGIVEVRNVVKDENSPYEQTTTTQQYPKDDIDWDKVNKLKDKYAKLTIAKLKKLKTTTPEERVAKSVTLKKGSNKK